MSGPGIGVHYARWPPPLHRSGSRPAAAPGSDVRDLEADVDQLRVRGVTFEEGIQEALWGRFIAFDDPDGNGLILQET